MKREILLIAIALGPLAVAACGERATEPIIGRTGGGAAFDVSARPGDEPGCTFDNGTTTCVTTTSHTETSTHQVFSGCIAGPPPNFHPGRRVRTFEDTWLVTVTTTTSRHGRAGLVYDTSTSESRELLTSREIASTCEAL